MKTTRANGYSGIWFTLGQYLGDEFGDKYSGGLGTYTAKHRPIAIHSAESNKTAWTSTRTAITPHCDNDTAK